MDFGIVVYTGKTPVVPEETRVEVPPKFKAFVQQLVGETRKNASINSPDENLTMELGRVQAVIKQIDAETVRKKQPIDAVGRSILECSRTAADPLVREKERILGIIASRAEAERRKRADAVRQAEEQARKEREAAAAEVAEVQNKLQAAKLSARDHLGELDAYANVKDLEAKLSEAQFNRVMVDETPVEVPKFDTPLVRGMSIPEEIIVSDEIDETKMLQQNPDYIRRLCNLVIKKQAVKDLAKQLIKDNKGNPKFDLTTEFAVAGLTVSVQLKPRKSGGVRTEGL